MDIWCKSTLDYIIENSTVNDNGCLIWNLGPYDTEKYKYGKIRLKLPNMDGKSKTYPVHRICYYAFHQNIHEMNNYTQPFFEVSHLCHEPRCVRPEHLVQESSAANANRRFCMSNKHCINCMPPCKFF